MTSSQKYGLLLSRMYLWFILVVSTVHSQFLVLHLDKGFKVVGSELCHRKLGQAFTYRSKWVKFWTLIIPLKKTRSVVWAINFYNSVFKNILLLTNCGQSKIPSVHTYCMLCTGWFILNGIVLIVIFTKVFISFLLSV